MNIFICGDSTAQTYDPAQTLMVGWGQLLGDFLPGVTVCNHAKAGRSTKSFLAEGRLQALDGQIKPGDLVLIQFAHNDENEKPERHTEPWTSYTDNLTAFIRFARERGAVPALLTPICMRVWENGALQETHGEYKDAMRSLAIKWTCPCWTSTGTAIAWWQRRGRRAARPSSCTWPWGRIPGIPRASATTPTPAGRGRSGSPPAWQSN